MAAKFEVQVTVLSHDVPAVMKVCLSTVKWRTHDVSSSDYSKMENIESKSLSSTSRSFLVS